MAKANSAETTPENMMLDDLKDLFWATQEYSDHALDYLAGAGVDTEMIEWAFDAIREAAIEALAKHVDGFSYSGNGLPNYETPEVFREVRTYFDGSPVSEVIKFPDAPGLTFVYRPRHDGPRDEFVAGARMSADLHKADVHARVASAGPDGARVYIEYIGESTFSVRAGDDGHLDLSRDHLQELREGIDRILEAQAGDESQRPESEG